MKKLFIVIFSIILSFNQNNIQKSFAQDQFNDQSQKVELSIPENNTVLAISRSNLDTKTAKVGDPFCARISENLTTGDTVLVPAGSIVSGIVTEVRQARRFAINKDGRIKLSINQIQLPDSRIISLAGQEINGIIVSPYTESLKRRIGERLPSSIAGSGTSIPLGQATDLNGGIVYAISVGASATAGFFSGLAVPDTGQTRISSAFERAFEGTPFGTIATFFGKGRPAGIETGCPIVLNFDNETVAKIYDQYAIAAATAAACPPVTVQTVTTE